MLTLLFYLLVVGQGIIPKRPELPEIAVSPVRENQGVSFMPNYVNPKYFPVKYNRRVLEK